MPYRQTPKEKLTKNDLFAMQQHAKEILDSLVTPQGIYASIDNGWQGPYHSWFGRDSAITADLIMAAVQYGGDKELARTALRGLLAFARWQGKQDNPATGEERGKMPHEIRDTFNSVDEVQHASGTNHMPWFVDPADKLLKNWDSVDSTALWVIAVLRLHKLLGTPFAPETLESLKSALEWIMRTMEKYEGLVGFVGADLQPERQYSGLHNQGWKDTFQIYQDGRGNLATHPIKDVLVNGEAWLALYESAEYFDGDFALRLRYMASDLKSRFNRIEDGFLLPNKTYYAQAIDGQGAQLQQHAADVAMCLWASHEGVAVIDAVYIDSVVRTVTGFDMFNPLIGIRNYAVGTVFSQGTAYHGSPNTYWPFVSALVARGLLRFGYASEAKEIADASLLAVERLGSNIEMFIETQNRQIVAWHHPKVGQQSSTEQAWTAAAVYFNTLFLLKTKY